MNKKLSTISVVGVLTLFLAGMIFPPLVGSQPTFYATCQKTICKETSDPADNLQTYLKEIKQNPTADPFPTLTTDFDPFGFWVCVTYQGDEFRKEIDISPVDIRGQLGNPDYRTKIKMDIDDDPQDDAEASFGFYKSSIDDGSNDVSSLETAFGFQLINDRVDDLNAQMEVWLELHINLSLLKNTAKGKTTHRIAHHPLSKSKLSQFLPKNLYHRLPTQCLRKLEAAFAYFNDSPIAPLSGGAEEDFFCVRVGHRSPEGDRIPEKFEKFFAFANASIFKPTIFKHEMNPGGDVIGSEPIDLMYGYAAYREGDESPSYDIEFSVGFAPAIYLVTKFTPRRGKVDYYYESTTYDENRVSFSTNLRKGSGEDVSLVLVFNRISEKLTNKGSWMSFDIDLQAIGAAFHYEASHTFDVAVAVASPDFEKEDGGYGYLQLNGIPKRIDASWDIDIQLLSKTVSGDITLDMSDNLAGILVYSPAYDKPVINVDNVPQRATIEGSINWKTLRHGHLRVEKDGGETSMTVNFHYKNWNIQDTLSIRDGYLDFSFGLSTTGYVGLDTSNNMFDNKLSVSDTVSGDHLTLEAEQVHADDFEATWVLDTSGGRPRIKDLGLSGLLRSLKNIHLSLVYDSHTYGLQGNWVLGQSGDIWFKLNQEKDVTYMFDVTGGEYELQGEITLPGDLQFDLRWNWIQGEDEYHPGSIYINKQTADPLLKKFNLYFTYQDTYGVNVTIENVCVYLDLEWWKNDNGRLFWWLDYEITGDFDLDLLWNGEWHTIK